MTNPPIRGGKSAPSSSVGEKNPEGAGGDSPPISHSQENTYYLFHPKNIILVSDRLAKIIVFRRRSEKMAES